MCSGVASASYLLESALTVKKSNRLRQAFTVIQVLLGQGTPSMRLYRGNVENVPGTLFAALSIRFSGRRMNCQGPKSRPKQAP